MRRRLLAVSLLLAVSWIPPARGARVALLDHAGMPYPGAGVHWGDFGARADEAGWIELADDVVPECATAPGAVPVALDASLSPDQVITLHRGATLRGLVLQPDGVPAPGITLRVEGDESLGPCARRAVSSADGSYEIGGLLPDRQVKLAVEAPDGFLAPASTLEVQAGASRRRLDVRVHPAVRVPVQVTGSDGAPLAGAVVTIETVLVRLALDPGLAEDVAEGIASFEATIGPGGMTLLPKLPRAAGWRVVARHPQHAPASQVLDLRAGTPTVTFAMRAGGSVALRALDEAGVPLAGIGGTWTSATVRDVDLLETPAASKGDGILRMRHLPAGTYELTLRGPGARPRLLRGIAVKEGAETAIGDVVLDPGASVEGLVTAEGSPLEGAKVTLWTRAEGARLKLEETTDAQGSFVFEGLDPDEKVEVRAAKDGHVPERKGDLAPGGEPVELDLARAAALVVTARDARTGEALPDATVRIADRGDPPSRVDVDRTSGVPGEMLVTELRPREIDVHVGAPGFMSEVRKGLTLVAGDEARIAVDLSPGATVEGKVVDAETGAAVALARVSVAAQHVEVVTATDGSFTLDGLRVPFDVSADHDAYQATRMTAVDPSRLAQRGLVVALERGGSVEGLVLGADGKPVVGASVTSNESEAGDLSDTEGHYRIDGLKPGALRLQKVDGAGTFDGLESAIVQITKGGVTRHDFGGGSRIVGTVTRGGEPLRGVRVAGLRIVEPGEQTGGFDADMSVASSGADGRYSLAVARAGEYGLTVAWRGHRFGQTVSVPEGMREVVADVAIPDLEVAGVVRNATTGEPIRGAHVTLRPLTTDARNTMSMGMSESTEDGGSEVVWLNTDPASVGESAADGSFAVLATKPGPCTFYAWASEYEMWRAPEDFAVTASRDDVVITMEPKAKGGRVKVRLLDAVTGDAVAGMIVFETLATGEGGSSNTMIHGGATVMTTEAPGENEVGRVVAHSEGRGLAVRGDIQPAEEDIEIDLRLSPGGSLRVLVPDDALQPDRMMGYKGDLRLRLASGFEMGPANVNMQMNVVGKLVSQAGPGEWIFRDLPPGPVTAALGDGAGETAEIVAGETVEVDLR